jgi:hypothetical protein
MPTNGANGELDEEDEPETQEVPVASRPPTLLPPRTPRPPIVVADPPIAPPSGLRHHNVNVALTVGEGDDVASRLTAIARELGGTIASCSSFSCSLKVPVERLSDAIQRISALGRADRPSVAVNDEAERYVDILSRISSIRNTLGALQTVGTRPGSLDGQLQLQGKEEALQSEVASLQHEARRIVQQASIANVTVNVEHPLRAPGESIRFRLPVPWLQRIGYNHLIDPPRTYQRSRSALDGRIGLSIGAPGSRNKLDAAATTFVAAHVRVGESAKGSVFGWAIGLDFEMGGAFGSGFLYATRFLAGPALFLGNRTVIALSPSIGVSGIKGGALSSAGELPFELSVTTDLGRALRLNLFSRPQWVFASESRKHGSKHVPFGDEWTNGGWLAFGRRHSNGESGGLLVGFTSQELMGTHLYSAMIGYHGAFFESPSNQ